MKGNYRSYDKVVVFLREVSFESSRRFVDAVGAFHFQNDDVIEIAVEKINLLLESFLGINDSELGMCVMSVYCAADRYVFVRTRCTESG